MAAKYVYTNTSDWLFSKDPTFALSDKYKKNVSIFNILFSVEDTSMTKRLCFDKCVDDFQSTNYSLKEKACMNSCISSNEKFLFNLDSKLDNIV